MVEGVYRRRAGRCRATALGALSALALAGTAACGGGGTGSDDSERTTTASDTSPNPRHVVEQAGHSARPPMSGPRIVFRHTGLGRHAGVVAMVPLADPGGHREFTSLACDRVDAAADHAVCLQTRRGTDTDYRLVEVGPDWTEQGEAYLPGTPSRTRLSPDGSLVATTTFVTGHAYRQVGFSTATEIREVGGGSLGDLEDFELRIDGRHSSAEDRNLWGVTFRDDRTFFATAATGGHTYLVRGDLHTHTLTALRENAECPSLSPDGRRIAYKVDDEYAAHVRAASAGAEPPAAGQKHWSLAVLDLATGHQTVLRGERRSVDDQVEWLDDDTLLYGLPRDGQPGVTDVWALDVGARGAAAATPHVLIEKAWSPAVVRP